jgi:cytochrome c-type biogenesis protein CcmF
MAALPGGLDRNVWSRAMGVQGLVTAAALAYTLFLSNPFARLDPAPFEGGDLNPLLQDPALALHPPMLYLGYVGLSAPFSLALAALLEGRADIGWARALRPWTLGAWTCLTIGIALGSYWAYYELGWGGWWFWDPVENASFMPWLAAVALLHSAIVTERRGGMANWTILLAIIGFGLALLGTFLVRSGVLTSVHAFAVDPERGVAVLAMFAVAMGVGFTLYALRAHRLARPSGYLLASREGALALNNVGLAVAAGTVLIGTLYPLAVDAVTGEVISVGPPYFNLTFGPLMGLVILAMPVGPFLAWRKADLVAALRQLWVAAAVAGAVAIAAAAWSKGLFWAAIGLGLGAWAILGALANLWRRAGRGAGRWARLAGLPIGLWAMTAAHAGIGVMTIGAVAEIAFRSETSVRMEAGASTTFAGRTVTLETVERVEGPNYSALRASFTVAEGAGRLARETAERRFYPAAGSPTTEVGILSNWGGDLYLALGEAVESGDPAADPAWTVRIYHNPLIHWIFAGATLLSFGGALAILALARQRLRRPAPAAANASAAAAPAVEGA